MSFVFSGNSKKQLDSCHPDLQKVLILALKRSDVDFGISEGHRTVATQQGYYAIGRTVDKHKSTITNIDGVKVLGKHNYKPSKAADLYVYNEDPAMRKKISFDRVHLAYLAGVIDSCAKELLEKGEIKSKIRWGGNWDSDGVIDYDQNLDDYPHVEII